MTFTHHPGAAIAVCGPRLGVLLSHVPERALLEELLGVVSDPAQGTDELLEVLVTAGIRQVADFGVAEVSDGGVRVVVRGEFVARVDGEDPVVSQGLWSDRRFAGAGKLTLGEDSQGGLPLLLGAARAGGLSWRDDRGQGVVPAGAAVHDEPAVAVADDAASADQAAAGDAASVPGEGSPAAGGDPHNSDSPAPVAEPVDAAPGADAADVESTPEPAPESDQAAAPAPPGYPHGHTLPSMIVPPGSFDGPPPGPTSPPVAVPPPTFIDSIPWAVKPGEAAVGETISPNDRVTPPPPTEDPELTVNRSSLPGAGAADPSVPMVVATRCPRGHLNPAYAGHCRVCGEGVAPQQPFETPRPPLGLLRFSNGEVVVLDRGCVLGRNPRVPSGHTGAPPNLVRLADPDKDISSQHLAVDLDYWHVTVKDLGSTNGTEVIPRGDAPTSLRPDDPVTIEPGTQVVLAGVLSFTYEVTE